MQLYIMMGVLLTLMQNGKMTAKQLAEKFEVSTRSIYRYIDSLSVNGVPIVTDSGRKGGIYLMNNFNLDNMFFTTSELIKIKDFLQAQDSPETTSLLEKVNYLLLNKNAKWFINMKLVYNFYFLHLFTFKV